MKTKNSKWVDPLERLNLSGDLPVEAFLTFQVNQLSTEFERQWTRYMRERAGVSLSEWRILAVLRKEAATFTSLVDTTGMNKALMSRSVHSLQSEKLIDVQATPSDARSITLSLNAKGRALLAEVLPLAMRRQRHFLEALSASERKVLYAAITKLKAAAITWEEAGNAIE